MFTDTDLDVFVSDFGVPVTFGSVTGRGILDAPGTSTQVGGMEFATTDYALTYKTAAFPGMDVGSVVTVNGKQFRVRDANALDDGAFTRATLAVA